MRAKEALGFLGKAVRYINGSQCKGPPDGVYRLIRIEQVTSKTGDGLKIVTELEIEEIDNRFKSYSVPGECVIAEAVSVEDEKAIPDIENEPSDRIAEIQRQTLEIIKAAAGKDK